MTITATYDSVLSRVQIEKTGIANPLFSNSGFEVNTTGWTASGGVLTRSTAQFHSGVASGLLTPSGTPDPSIFFAVASSPVVYPGETVRLSAWVRSATGHALSIAVLWLDASDAYLADFVEVTQTPAANTWVNMVSEVVVPPGAVKASAIISSVGATAAGDLLYADDVLLNVEHINVERSLDQVRWISVRGGAEAVGGTAGTANDYEFSADVQNFYRARGETASITPTLDGVWLKSITRPFLNRKLGKHGMVDNTISRVARQGLFYVRGRTAPVAVTDVRGGKDFGLRIVTTTREDAATIDYILASGDILFLHTPTTSRIPTVYVAAGDAQQRFHGITDICTFLVPLTEVQAPGPEVVGATVTWATIIADFATWTDVLAFFPTWADVLEYVADPSEVIVS